VAIILNYQYAHTNSFSGQKPLLKKDLNKKNYANKEERYYCKLKPVLKTKI
jgi:hypothetical protein